MIKTNGFNRSLFKGISLCLSDCYFQSEFNMSKGYRLDLYDVTIFAKVTSLVSLSAAVDVSIGKVNLTIAGKMYCKNVTFNILFLNVQTQVELAVHLDNIAKMIIGKTFVDSLFH